MFPWIRRHPLIAFFALAYALSWWPWLWTQRDPEAPSTILPTGPLLAALILLPVLGGWPATKSFLARIVAWRVGLRWYLVALLLPVAVTILAVGLNLVLGAAMPAATPCPGAVDLLQTFVFILLFIGLGEEPAWRGFALPRLLARHNALQASLILGALHAIWHLPLFGVEYDLQNGLPWVIGVFAFAVVATWIWRHTGGSLLLPMLMHSTVNTAAFPFRWFAGGDQLRLWWLFGALWCLVAVFLALRYGPSLQRRGETGAPASTG